MDTIALLAGEEHIELYKILKVQSQLSGGEAKVMIDQGRVSIDGEVETRRRKKVRLDQVVNFNGEDVVVIAAKET